VRRLALRQVTATCAHATRVLGAGATLPFTVGGMAGELTLRPQALPPAGDGLWLDTAVGPVWLSDAGAVLSLMSEQPVVVQGPPQPWYWQFVSQHLAPQVAQGLAPLAPLAGDAPEGVPVHCRLAMRVGDQQAHAYMSLTPDSLMQWLQVPGWQRLQHAVADSFETAFPVVLGHTELSVTQLASLSPGDVLLPVQCLFDTLGQGLVAVAGRHWAGQAVAEGSRLFFTLSHEE
jgi:type III secretion protein Q